ncbi:hypothetical protein NDN08_005878 [Rhodosorus marinus]|uniref:OCEL domain-containing protein n=1 Tax=Rhodosorus marinus TaxID=101924 RepID=A0AAV8V2V8_9RHOD|nr:hypothetical protein NDN08_005878 [Rhodosorus marinus]
MESKMNLLAPASSEATMYTLKLPSGIHDALEKGQTGEMFFTMDRKSGKCTLEFKDEKFSANSVDERSFVEVYEQFSAQESCRKIGGIRGKVTVRGGYEPGAEKRGFDVERGQKAKIRMEASKERGVSKGSREIGTKREPPASRPRPVKAPRVSTNSSSESSSGMKKSTSQGQIASLVDRSKSPVTANGTTGKPRPRSSSHSPASRFPKDSDKLSPLRPPEPGGQGSSPGYSRPPQAKGNRPPLPPSSKTPSPGESEKAAFSPRESKTLRKVKDSCSEYEQEVVQLLAVSPLTQEQIKEKVPKGTHPQILDKVADHDELSGKYGLKSELWPEVVLEWEKYSENDRHAVSKNLSRSQVLTDSELNKILDGELPRKANTYYRITTAEENERYRVDFNRKYRIYNTLGKNIYDLKGKLEKKQEDWSSAKGKEKDALAVEITELYQKTNARDRRMRQYYSVLHYELKELKERIKDW